MSDRLRIACQLKIHASHLRFSQPLAVAAPGPIELLEGMQGHVEPTLKMKAMGFAPKTERRKAKKKAKK